MSRTLRRLLPQSYHEDDCSCLSKTHRDKKSRWKPPLWYKKMKRRQERAQIAQAMREGKEVPRFRKTDVWEWA